MFPLQTFVFPTIESIAPLEMYYRMFGAIGYSKLSEGVAIAGRGSAVFFDTYFNGLSVGKWKSTCTIEDLHVSLRGTGKILFRLGIHQFGLPDKWLDEREIDLSPHEDVTIEVSKWNQLK